MRSLSSWVLAGLLFLPLGVRADTEVDAGEPATLECASPSGSEYTLNGSAPTGDGFGFSWSTDPPVRLTDADTLTPTGAFPLGETTVTLTSRGPGGVVDDETTVTVLDSEGPVARAAADPFVLWPPNHRMQEVEVELRVHDRCSERGDLDVALVGARSNEPDDGQGDGHTSDDIQRADLGQDDRHVLLRAERAGGGVGRVYTLTYAVTDAAGKTTEVDAEVRVPHDAADLARLLDKADGHPEDMQPICPAPVGAVDRFTDAFPELSESPSKRACLRACRVWTAGCSGIVKGSSQCLRAEGRSRALLRAIECRNEESKRDAHQCRSDLKAFVRQAAERLRAQTAEAGETCQRRGQRCANACDGLFDRE